MKPFRWKFVPVIDADMHDRDQEPIPHELENGGMANHTRGVIRTWRGDPVKTQGELPVLDAAVAGPIFRGIRT
jgi:hypothetical protein